MQPNDESHKNEQLPEIPAEGQCELPVAGSSTEQSPKKGAQWCGTISKGYWAKFSPEQRSQIMRDRLSKASRKKLKPRPKAPAKQYVKLSDLGSSLWIYDKNRILKEIEALRRSHLDAAENLGRLLKALNK